MFIENEGTEIEQQPGVEPAASPEPQSDTQPEPQNAAPKAQEVPFHEHPRWKEVMEERNAEKQRAQALEQQLQQMQRQIQESHSKKQAPQDPMYERLKGIDPEFADYLKDVREQAALAKQLQEELGGMRHEQFVSSATQKFHDLNKANNVSPELGKLYYNSLDLAVREGKIKSVSDFERAYEELHGSTKKFLEAHERAALEKYTASKKQDASKPTGQAKARTPAAGKIEFSKDPAEAKAQMVKQMAAALRGSRENL